MSGRSFWLACLSFLVAAAPAAAAPPGFLDDGFENGSRFVTHVPQPRVSVGGLVPGPRGGSYVIANTETSEFADSSSGGTLLLVRYDRRGRPVRSFGDRGTYSTDFPAGPVKALGMARQPDGKLVVVGSIVRRDRGEHHAFIARFFPDGTLDGAFAGGGMQVIDLDGCCEVANDIALDAGGRFVVVGSVLAGQSQPFVARFRADGTLDPEFGIDGVVRRPAPPLDPQEVTGRTLALARDGTIFFSGAVRRSSRGSGVVWPYVARLSRDGADLVVREVGSPAAVFNDIAFDDAHGRLYAAGSRYYEESNRTTFWLVAFRSDLSVPRAFGNGGAATANFARTWEDRAASAIVDRRGRIVLAGAAVGPPPKSLYGPPARSDFALARFTRRGRLDQSFGRRGRARVRFRQRQNVARELIELPGGRLLVAGTGGAPFVLEGTGATVALARLTAD